MIDIKKAPLPRSADQDQQQNEDTKLLHQKIKKSAPKLDAEEFTGDTNRFIEDHENAALGRLANECLIKLSEKLEPPPIAMQIMEDGNPITLFSKGNFSIITGAAKSRKSFLVSMLVAASLKSNFQDLFVCDQPGTTIIFDTEQAKYKVQQVAKRICNLSEKHNPSNLLVYSLRTLEPSERLEVISHALATTPNINFVAIDGIIDLEIDPILQADQAQKIVMKLMQWSEIYNIHITCVLHYNKTVSTLLGHLGSFSHRKADAIIEVTKNKDDENVSIVRPVDCREKEFLPFAFSVDPQGMPYILKDYIIDQSKPTKEPKEKKPAFSATLLDETQHQQILLAVFKKDQQQSYNKCWRNIKIGIEKVTAITAGDNKAKDFLAYYLLNGSIIKIEQKPKPVYVLPGQAALSV